MIKTKLSRVHFGMRQLSWLPSGKMLFFMWATKSMETTGGPWQTVMWADEIELSIEQAPKTIYNSWKMAKSEYEKNNLNTN